MLNLSPWNVGLAFHKPIQGVDTGGGGPQSSLANQLMVSLPPTPQYFLEGFQSPIPAL